MDIHCRHCGEPWDHDELHDVHLTTYREAVQLFRKLGCGAFGFEPTLVACKAEPIFPAEMLQLIATAQDLTPYPDEWSSPDEIEMMIEFAEDL